LIPCIFALLLSIGMVCYFNPAGIIKWNRPKSAPQLVESGSGKLSPPMAFLNTKPEVKYVGDETCGACHPTQAASYRRHPMGQSFAPISTIAPTQKYSAETHNPFDQFGLQFSVHFENGKTFHQQKLRNNKGDSLFERKDQVSYVLGSGTHGRAYLFDRDGYLYESPISWFSQKNFWDISPGFVESILSGRPITANCLFCHSNHVRPIPNSLNHYEKPVFDGYSIGCERCHGPGQLHVEKQERAENVQSPDDTIVNPGKLPPALREAVCQQCHLLGTSRHLRLGRQVFDYRPGLPLPDYWAVFVPPPLSSANSQAVGQVEQMYASRCFRGSGRNLGCVSCHDPHELPAEEKKIDYYRKRCLQCHETKACTAPQSDRLQTAPLDNCISCHMPRFPSADIAHTASTDHRIRRRSFKSLLGPKPWSPGEMPIVDFFQESVDSANPEQSRDLGIALVFFGLVTPDIARDAAKLAVPYLDECLQKTPQDVPAIEARAKAFWILGRREEARADLDRGLALAPNSEALLSMAGLYASAANDFEAAKSFWQRAKAVNPWDPSFHFLLARQYSVEKDWPKAIEECLALIRLDPSHFDGRQLMLLCWIRTGKMKEAQRELGILVALKPDQMDRLKRAFEQLIAESK
jgi:hypothetical protein